jgi:predicted MPP superfamily phosphohydrolase
MHDLPYLLVLVVVTILSLKPVKKRGTWCSWFVGGLLLSMAGITVAIIGSGFRAFHLMRLVAWVVFLCGPVYLLASGFFTKGWTRLLSVGLGLCVSGIAIDAFFIEPHRLEVTTHTISSPLIERPIRVVALADFQTDHIGDYERRVLKTAKDLAPDLLVFPGDYIQVGGEAYRREGKVFNQLLKDLNFKPRLGAYAVEGDVEVRGWESLFSGTGIHPMGATTITNLGELELVGLTLMASRRGVELPAKLGFRIVLGHAPDFALHPVDADLILAGHTHGGQVQIPFIGPLLTLSGVPKTWADGGLTTLEGGRRLIVSRGIGMERGGAPRLRFNCRPEIVVVDLVPEDAGTQ